ncbi:MAG: M14 family zinc carboxypeptidase [Chloroflexota bacterium]
MIEQNLATRRSFLRFALTAAGVGMALQPRGAAAEPVASVIGESQRGAPLTVHRFGDGARKLFILGGQHGGPEANTTELARNLMAHLAENPGEVASNVSVFVMPEGNPDGLATGVRQYASGVDPNRNWGSLDWQSDAYDSNGRFRPGLGGPAPFSEAETWSLGNWMWRTWPDFIINYHSAGGFMFGGGEGLPGELADLYAQASGYPRPTGGGGRSPLSYRATGNLNGWARGVGIGGCLIELTSPSDPEFGRNLAGVRAVLARLGEQPAP